MLRYWCPSPNSEIYFLKYPPLPRFLNTHDTHAPPPPFWIDIITAVPPYADLQIVFRAKFLPLTLLPLTQILNYIFLFLPAPITPSSDY